MQSAAPVVITDAMVEAAANGDPAQRQQLFERLTPQVRVMINARLNPSLQQLHLVEDLVQETMLGLSAASPAGLSSLQRRTAPGLRAFVSTIVSRRVADALRVKVRLQHPATLNGSHRNDNPIGRLANGNGDYSTIAPLWGMLSASGPSPLSEIEHSERIRQIMAALAQLKDEHRTAITLAFFDQLETRDIAEHMGVSRAAATMLVIRAIKALRRHLTGFSTLQSHSHPTGRRIL